MIAAGVLIKRKKKKKRKANPLYVELPRQNNIQTIYTYDQRRTRISVSVSFAGKKKIYLRLKVEGINYNDYMIGSSTRFKTSKTTIATTDSRNKFLDFFPTAQIANFKFSDLSLTFPNHFFFFSNLLLFPQLCWPLRGFTIFFPTLPWGYPDLINIC